MPSPDRLDFLSENWHAMRPDIDISPWQVWGRVTRLHEIFLGNVTRSLRHHELSFTEFQTLAALVLAGKPYRANPNQIARFNLLTSGGLANLLGRMERECLIERGPDTTDKRGVTVQLTDRGLQHFNEALLEENRVEHDLLASLTADERGILAMLLRKLLLSVDHVAFNGRARAPEAVASAGPAQATGPGQKGRRTPVPRRRRAGSKG